ncbi:MAG: hypothetical protein S4CHLAM102_04130 [Chlamydiia bacterium]|nr:hypothetical protein [Chlamydiia bacterium]
MKLADHLTIRLGNEQDKPYLKKWLADPKIYSWFPIEGPLEIEDAARISMGYCPMGAALTAEWDGVPCGFAHLYVNAFKALKHQCLFSIVLDPEFRGRGIGTQLMEELMKLAKEKFQITLLHLEVYKGNPAIGLYTKLGFKEYGVQEKFLKEKTGRVDKVLMQKEL